MSIRTFDEYCALDSMPRSPHRARWQEELNFDGASHWEDVDSEWGEDAEYGVRRDVEAIFKRPVDIEELAALT